MTTEEKEKILKEKKEKNTPHWLVVYTKSRNEKKVNDRLIENGIETYLPLYKTLRVWKDRKKKVELPLFNSYIFVHVKESDRARVLSVPGVVRFLFYLKKPAVVRDQEIKAIKRFLKRSEGMKIEVKIGEQVLIEAGHFRGVTGKVIRIGKSKLYLHIEQLSIIMTAEIDPALVRSIKKTETN